MRRTCWTLILLAIAATTTALAQPPAGLGSGRGGQGGGADGDFRPPPHPIIEAIDADHDHEISSTEIKNASAALLSLDRNKDGKLTEDETRPQSPRGAREGRPGADRRNLDGPPAGGRTGRNGGRGNGGGLPGRQSPDRGPQNPDAGPPSAERFVQHALQFDADKDGKLSEQELSKFADEIVRRRQQQEGAGPDGDRDDAGGPPESRAEGQRFERPRRPE